MHTGNTDLDLQLLVWRHMRQKGLVAHVILTVKLDSLSGLNTQLLRRR